MVTELYDSRNENYKKRLNKEFFEKYQTQLLYVANNPIGKWYLGIRDPREIIKLTNNSYCIYKGQGQYQTTFRTYPIYENKLRYLINLAKIGFVLPFTQGLPLSLLTITSVFSGAGDGQVYIDDNLVSWASVRDAATGTADYTGNNAEIASRKTTAPSWGNYRAFLPFDTSSIPDTDDISATTLKIYGKIKRNATTGWALHCVETSQASTTELVAADYDNLTFTDLGSIAEASVAINQYNDIVLNATGLTKVSKTGTSKLGVITSFDLNNTEPSATGTDAGYRGLNFSTSEATGTSEDPILEVTHSAPATTSTTTTTSSSTSTTSTSSSTTTTTTTSTSSSSSTSTTTSTSSSSSTSTTITTTSTSTTSTSSSTTTSSSSSTSTTTTVDYFFELKASDAESNLHVEVEENSNLQLGVDDKLIY